MDDRERLLRVLEELSPDELRTFAYFLGPAIPRGRLDPVTAVRLAELLLQFYPDTAVDVAAVALEKIPRKDLRQVLRGGRGMAGAGPQSMEVEEEPPRFAPPPVPSRRVSDPELMKLGKKLGGKWKQIGIEFLGVENSSLEQIEEDNNGAAMRAFSMLKNWKNREKERATPARLYHILDKEEVQLDHDVYAFLLESA